MQRRTYTPEQKAQAMARVLSGETVSGVAREMDIERITLQQWMKREQHHVTAVVTAPDTGTLLQQRLAVLLEKCLITLTTHVEHYGGEEWIEEQPAETLMESTRLVGGRFTAIMDRLGNAVTTTQHAGNNDSDND
jgi:transposase-like protein